MNSFIIDVLERFQLSAYLSLIIIRNFLEMTGGAGVEEILSYLHDISVTIFTTSKPLNFYNPAFIPSYLTEMIYDIGSTLTSIQNSSNYKLFTTLLFPALYVVGSEIIVDSLKHAFITKFNGIPASIYSRYTQSLFRDLAGTSLQQHERPKWESEWNQGEINAQGHTMVWFTLINP